MERRDNVTGGGYTDGLQAGAWYTWNEADGTDTTSAATTDRGTPGADNTDPNTPHSPTVAFQTPVEGGDGSVFVDVSVGNNATCLVTLHNKTTGMTGQMTVNSSGTVEFSAGELGGLSTGDELMVVVETATGTTSDSTNVEASS